MDASNFAENHAEQHHEENHDREAHDREAHDREAHDREALLARMIQGTRNVAAISQLSDAQLFDAIEDWDEVLLEVPTSGLDALRREGLRCGFKSAGEFLDAWRAGQAQEFARRQDAERRRQDSQWQAKAQSGELRDGPGYRAAQWNRRRWGRGLLAVCCECDDSAGYAIPAVFDTFETHWVCAAGRCAFHWPIRDTMDAPLRGEVGPLGREMLGAESTRALEEDFDYGEYGNTEVAA
jgi:hypothetical protein